MSTAATDYILFQPGCLAAAIARAMIAEADRQAEEKARAFIVKQMAADVVRQWEKPLVED